MSKTAKEKILVTGAGGYIGSVATYLLLQKGYSVVALDNFITGYKQPLELLQAKFGQDKLKIYELDLNKNLDQLFEQEKDIQAVLHYAAHCLVDESMKQPAKYFQNNVGGSSNLLAHLVKHNIKNLVFSSTCAVYGEAQYVPVDEKHPTIPENPYGESKRMVEAMLQWYARLGQLNCVILRYFNVCGTSDDSLIGDSKRPSVLLVQNAVRGALGLEPFYLTCPKVDTPDQTPIRDYINVVDLNEAHIKALGYLFNKGKSTVINLGTGKGNSVLEIISQVEQQTGKTLAKQFSKHPRSGEYAKMIADITKAKTVLGWVPQRDLKDSVNTLLNWYQKQPQGWQH